MGFDAERAVKATVEWIRDWFEANGPGCNAIVGISGGKDSSIAAARRPLSRIAARSP